MSDEPNPTDQPLAPAESPLVEADPNSVNDFIAGRVDEIMNRPPLMVSDADLRYQVEYYRRDRERFLRESQEKANKPPRTPGAKRKPVPKSVADAIASSVDLL